MLLLIKLAFRNLFRNKRRTILAGSAIGLGLAAMMFADAVIFSVSEKMVHLATESFSGNAQIHHTNFLKNFDIEYTIKNNQNNELLKNLSNEPGIASYAPRVLSYGMITSTLDSNNILLYGVDPNLEKNVSKIHSSIQSGTFDSLNNDHMVLIGNKLAENLGVKIGEKIVITLAKKGGGDLSQEMFHIGGIFDIGIRGLNENVVFMNLHDAQKMLNLENEIHEIAINCKDLKQLTSPTFPLIQKYSTNDNQFIGWNKMFKELDAILHFTKFSLSAVAIILFSIIALGIMNTIFMSLYERIYEFGVLKAVGTRPATVGQMILWEALILAVMSTILGIVLGFCLIFVFSKIGIDYRGVEYAHLVLSEKIYPQFRTIQFIIYPPALIIFSFLVGIYPAIYAAKIIPAQALRKSQ